jgi:hypothetical protein
MSEGAVPVEFKASLHISVDAGLVPPPPPFILSLLFPVDTSKRAGGKEQTLATTLQTNVFLSSPFPLFSHHFSSARNSSAAAEAFFIRPSADANILLPQLPTEFR